MTTKEIINKIAESDGLTHETMYEKAGYKHRPNFTVALNKGSITGDKLLRFLKENEYRVIIKKGKNRVEL